MLCEYCKTSHKSSENIKYCEECGKEICVDCGELILGDLTENWYCSDCVPVTYKYPEGFHDFSKGVDIKEDVIKQWLRDIKQRMQRNKSGYYTFEGSGDTIIIGLNMDDEYDFYVCQNYKSMSVPIDQIKNVEF